VAGFIKRKKMRARIEFETSNASNRKPQAEYPPDSPFHHLTLTPLEFL